MSRRLTSNLGHCAGMWLLAGAVLLVAMLLPCQALANIDEGICGTCEWVIGDDGTLSIGAGTLNSMEWDYWGNYYSDEIKYVVCDEGVKAPESLASFFEGCSSLISVDLSGWDTSSVVDMRRMFYGCSSLVSLDLSGWDTSSVENMGWMFYGCSSLASLDLSGWDTSSVVEEDYTEYFEGDIVRYAEGYRMFGGCFSLSCWRVGKDYAIKSSHMVPDATDRSGKWQAASEKVWYTKPDIVVSRSGRADTYTAADLSGTSWIRLAGATRYDTMEAMVAEGRATGSWGSNAAVIATGKSFPDALVASSVAGFLHCPVLLTDSKSLSPQAERQLKALGTKRVYVIGGKSAVSDAVLSKLKRMGISCERIASKNRQETSLEALHWLEDRDGYNGEVVVATGEGFADALSIGPWCYDNSIPILLTDGKGNLSKKQLDAMPNFSCEVEQVIIVGGTSAVSQATEDAIESRFGIEVERLGGADRYDTARVVAAWELGEGMLMSHAAVATGANFPDALAGGALCGANGSILLLASDDYRQALSLLADNAPAVLSGYVLGGDSAVSESLEEYLRSQVE